MMHGPKNIRCHYLFFCIFDLGGDNAKRYSELLFRSRFTFSVPNTLTAGLWWWRHFDISKRRQLHTSRHGVKSQAHRIFSNTSVRTSHKTVSIDSYALGSGTLSTVSYNCFVTVEVTYFFFSRRLIAVINQTHFDLHIYTLYESVFDSFFVFFLCGFTLQHLLTAKWGVRFSVRGKATVAWLWPLPLTPKFRIGGAMILFPLYAFMPWTGATLLIRLL